MAFMGMVFAGIFLVLFVGYLGLTLLYFVLALILKLLGKQKDNPKLQKAGTVFLVLGIVFAVPLVLLVGYGVIGASFWKVTLPDGRTACVSSADVRKMQGYAENPDDASLDSLDILLTKHKELVYYHDNNRESVLDIGIGHGSAEVVQIALAHGAVIDNPERYDHMSYVSGSLDSLLAACNDRPVTEDDVKIARMLFDHHAAMTVKLNAYGYSNLLGEAAWSVLYNDERVTDTELALLQVFREHGLNSDPVFLQEFGSAGHPEVTAVQDESPSISPEGLRFCAIVYQRLTFSSTHFRQHRTELVVQMCRQAVRRALCGVALIPPLVNH